MIKVTLLALLSVSTIASATLTFNSTITDPGEKKPWFDGTITSSSNVTAACASAYAQPIPCDQWLIKSQNEEMAVDSALNGVCTDACLAGLKKWRDDVRKECTSSDVIGVDEGDAAMYIAKLLDTSKKFIEYIYWMNCIRDLNTGSYCIDVINSTNIPEVSKNETENTPDMIAAFCKDNCLTQLSVFAWTILASILDHPDVDVADARKVCSGLDTSRYPFLKDTSNTTTTSTNGGGNSGTSGNSTNSGNSSGTGGSRNAGGKVVGSVGATAVVFALLMFGLGGL